MSISFMDSNGGANIRIVATASGISVRIHNNGANLPPDGSAFAGLSIADAIGLSRALNEAIGVAATPDPRQASLWPEER